MLSNNFMITYIFVLFQTWQKRLLVLRDAPKCQNSRLEVYNTDKNWYERKTEHFIVELQNVSAIEEYNASKSYPYAFTLTRKVTGLFEYYFRNQKKMYLPRLFECSHI